MNVSILISTPNKGIGNLIFQTLDESGKYSVRLVSNGEDTITTINQHVPNICIIDESIQDILYSKLHRKIKKIDGDISVIAIPLEDAKSSAQKLNADAYLPIPFYTPDLFSLLDKLLSLDDNSEFQPELSIESKDNPDSIISDIENSSEEHWLEDLPLAEEQLAKVSSSSSSDANVIIREGKVWVSVGTLSQAAIDEMITSVEKSFGNKSGSDLARFIHLDETNKDYMLYATNLGSEFELVVLFNFDIPFSQIRAESNKMAIDLKKFETNKTTSDLKEKLLPHKQNLLKIKSLFEDESDVDEMISSKIKFDHNTNEDTLVEEIPEIDTYDEITEPFEKLSNEDNLAETQLSNSNVKTKEEHNEENEIQAEEFQNLEETVLSKVSEDVDQSSDVVLEPVSPSIYNLNYACVLIPRFSDQFLTGSRATRLTEWVTQLCLAFGWRLEQLSVRPEFIQWIVNVPPSTSPGYLIRIIRQHTSRRMFSDFPRLESTNPSGDFWAPGYLIMNGNQPPPTKLIKEFIKNSRTRQGV